MKNMKREILAFTAGHPLKGVKRSLGRDVAESITLSITSFARIAEKYFSTTPPSDFLRIP